MELLHALLVPPPLLSVLLLLLLLLLFPLLPLLPQPPLNPQMGDALRSEGGRPVLDKRL